MATKDNGNQGIKILFKRTNLEYTDTKVNSEDEALNFGEPLYINSEHTIVVGDGEDTETKEKKVFKAMDRSRADLYDKMDTDKLDYMNKADLTKFEWLQKVDQSKLNTILETSDDKFEWLNTVGQTTLDTIKETTLAKFTWLKTVSQDILNTIENTALAKFTWLKTVSQDILNTIENTALAKFTWLSTVSQDTLDTIKETALSKFEWLNNIAQTSLDSILNVWKNHYDSANSIGTVWLDNYVVDTNWYTYDASTGEPTSTLADSAPCAKKISVTGVTDSMHPVLTTPVPLTEFDYAKAIRKASAQLTKAEVKNDYIILYCAVKKP